MELTDVSMAPPRYDPRFFFVFSCLKDLPRVGFRSLLARSPHEPRAFFCVTAEARTSDGKKFKISGHLKKQILQKLRPTRFVMYEDSHIATIL